MPDEGGLAAGCPAAGGQGGFAAGQSVLCRLHFTERGATKPFVGGSLAYQSAEK